MIYADPLFKKQYDLMKLWKKKTKKKKERDIKHAHTHRRNTIVQINATETISAKYDPNSKSFHNQIPEIENI